MKAGIFSDDLSFDHVKSEITLLYSIDKWGFEGLPLQSFQKGIQEDECQDFWVNGELHGDEAWFWGPECCDVLWNSTVTVTGDIEQLLENIECRGGVWSIEEW